MLANKDARSAFLPSWREPVWRDQDYWSWLLVILGGLLSSTLLDFFVHPALFWKFGKKEAEAQLEAHEDDVLNDP